MSGIFGIIHSGSKKGEPISDTYLKLMQDALQHLGPNGSNIMKGDGIGVGHLSMNITPESIYEDLPCLSSNRRFMISSDTRLDNREELARRLSISLGQLNIIPDSQLILKCYETWGESCPEYLLGEFVFVIWDKKEKKLFCARDHIGTRCLYYYQSSTHFIFASQINGITKLPFVTIRLNESHLAKYLLVPVTKSTGETHFKNILSLKGSRSLTFQDGKVHINTYWSPTRIKEIRYAKDSDYAEALRELLFTSVHNRIRTLPHLEVGISLSGGLDSSSLACIAARKLKGEGRCLTSVASVLPEGHKGIESDERIYIQAVLQQEHNIRIQYVTSANSDPFGELELAIEENQKYVKPAYYMDRALWRKARQDDIRVMLFGLGGDQTASYQGDDSLYRLVKRGRLIQAFHLARMLAEVESKSLKNIMRRYVIRPIIPPWLKYNYQNFRRNKPAYRQLQVSAAQPDFAAKYGISQTRIRKQLYPSKRYPLSLFNKLKTGRFAIREVNSQLSHFGINGLYPFYDKPLIEFCMAIPPGQFLAGGWRRSLLRRAMEGILPKSIQWRVNKYPYTPDYHQRIFNIKENIAHLLDHITPNDPILRYIDIKRLQNHIPLIKPAKGRHDWNIDTSNVLGRGIIAMRFLKWLEKK